MTLARPWLNWFFFFFTFPRSTDILLPMELIKFRSVHQFGGHRLYRVDEYLGSCWREGVSGDQGVLADRRMRGLSERVLVIDGWWRRWWEWLKLVVDEVDWMAELNSWVMMMMTHGSIDGVECYSFNLGWVVWWWSRWDWKLWWSSAEWLADHRWRSSQSDHQREYLRHHLPTTQPRWDARLKIRLNHQPRPNRRW